MEIKVSKGELEIVFTIKYDPIAGYFVDDFVSNMSDYNESDADELLELALEQAEERAHDDAEFRRKTMWKGVRGDY